MFIGIKICSWTVIIVHEHCSWTNCCSLGFFVHEQLWICSWTLWLFMNKYVFIRLFIGLFMNKKMFIAYEQNCVHEHHNMFMNTPMNNFLFMNTFQKLFNEQNIQKNGSLNKIWKKTVHEQSYEQWKCSWTVLWTILNVLHLFPVPEPGICTDVFISETVLGRCFIIVYLWGLPFK